MPKKLPTKKDFKLPDTIALPIRRQVVNAGYDAIVDKNGKALFDVAYSYSATAQSVTDRRTLIDAVIAQLHAAAAPLEAKIHLSQN